MKLPKTLYVKREEDGDDVYFIASENMRSLVNNVDDTLTIGTYQLTETNKVETLLKISGRREKGNE